MKKAVLLAGISLAVGASSHADSTIADWTFETSQPLTAGPFTPEGGSGSASGSHVGAAAYSSPAGNGSTHSFSANTWATGDFYQFQVSTVGFSNIKLSYDQTSSNTGPGFFDLEYSTDGQNFTTFVSQYTVLANAAPNTWTTTGTPVAAATFTEDFSAIVALNNASTVFFRMVEDSGTTSANGMVLMPAGTDRLDNVIVTGLAVPEPSTLALLGLGSVTGLFFARRKK